METEHTSVQENIPSSVYPAYRPTCTKGLSSNPLVHVMEVGPIQ